MEISLKQRLIGASVLIALAVIFFPMFLDGSGQKGRVTNKSIVIPEPEFKFEDQLPRIEDMGAEPLATSSLQSNSVATPETTIKPEDSSNTAPSTEPTQPPAKSQPVTKPPTLSKKQTPLASNPTPETRSKPTPKTRSEPKPTTKANSTPLGWVVQVGSFKHKKNAVNLRNKLRRAGYAAFEDTSGNSKSPIYRVKVGPESRRDRAIALRARLLAQQKLKGIVIQNR